MCPNVCNFVGFYGQQTFSNLVSHFNFDCAYKQHFNSQSTHQPPPRSLDHTLAELKQQKDRLHFHYRNEEFGEEFVWH